MKKTPLILFSALLLFMAAVLVKVIINWPGVKETATLPAEYQAFFSDRGMPAVTDIATKGFANRNPVSRFDYGEYEILLASAAVKPDFSLETGIQFSDQPKGFGFVSGTTEFDMNKFSGLVNLAPGADNSDARVQFSGDSLSASEKGDSIRIFDLKLADLNFYFNGNSQADFCLEADRSIPDEKAFPATLVFRKSHSRLFICLISQKEGRTVIPRDELYALILSQDTGH